MARKAQWVQIGRHQVELSNLDKVLYPDDQTVKAEIIEYYLKIAPTILSHLKGRPLTLLRFPDGIYGETFYQKNRPDWAPDWIEYQKLGKEKKDYIIPTSDASLVWLANLACLELHQMHSRKPHYEHPDYFVFDIDPPEGYDFTNIVDLSLRLKEHVEKYGYQTFVKTTGGKGVHILVPIEPKWDFHEAFQAARDIAQPFVDKNSDTTLHIKKEARKGRVLIDIYRNRGGQSIIGAYSLRGRIGVPVSLPLHWADLEKLKDPKEYNIKTALEKVLSEGDAWEGMAAYAAHLHTKPKPQVVKKDFGPGDKYKTPEQLESYDKKRDFSKTDEPVAEYFGAEGNGFVVHRHHASRLHYDLRLEQDGTLKSWAVPRGLPPRPGVKRLAVATEDHPMKYLTWEGIIPKGEYGGGKMWVYALGKYDITKEKKSGFYFFLHSKEVDAEYRIHLMKEKEWLLERVDNPQIDWPKGEVEFMMADSANDPPKGEEYIYEIKWDGIRALICVDEGEVTILSRSHRNINKQFPELMVPEKAFRATSALFDAEIVCFDEDGKPDFKKVINRLMKSNDGDIERSTRRNPAYCYIFDCLYLDGRPLINEPLHKRREWLLDSVKHDTPYRVSDIEEDGDALFTAAKEMGLEGIVAKDINSKYLPGKRSSNWLKIKVRNTTDCLIIGFTKGNGDREPYFGALQIAENENNKLLYRGKVGTGFNDALMKEVKGILLEQTVLKERPIDEKPLDNDETTWIEPKLWCEIQYAMITKNNTFREPVFVRMRPDME
ncbi:MAG: non-homologous end-joining DNA ligase [Cyclobacteriaceae bacterium]